MIDIERLHKLIANGYSNKEFAMYYLFHLCTDPEFLTYKDMFEFEPANKLTNLVNHGYFTNALINKYIIKRFKREYVDCFDDGRAKFLSVIKDALYEHQNSLKSNTTDSSQLDGLNKTDSLQSDNVNKIPDEPAASPKPSIIQNLIHNGYYSTIENGVLVKFDERDLVNNSFTIPNDVTIIGERAFFLCINLKHLTIPNGVTTIDPFAFFGCFNLETVSLPSTLTSIGGFGFFACKNLKRIAIPSKVTYLEDLVFGKCISLEEVKFHSRIKMTSSTFTLCNKITPINLPKRLKQDWDDGKFEQTYYLCHIWPNILDDCDKKRMAEYMEHYEL